jgi:pimeloyl-ACP methyl ester carboxylesterase
MDILFVHGALVRDGRWWWQPAADLLEAETGIRSRSLALPSCGERPADPVRIADAGDGRLGVAGYDADPFGARFLHDGTSEQQREAFRRVTTQDATSFSTPITRAGWQGVDSTYLVCTDDRSTSTALQREHAARATRSVDVPTGHHPFLTRPDLVVAQLRAFG